MDTQGFIALYYTKLSHNKRLGNLKYDSVFVQLLQKERKVPWEEVPGTPLHSCWATVITA